MEEAIADAVGRRLVTVLSTDGPEESDLELLKAHVRRLLWRLSFWERRRAQLKLLPVQTPVQPPVTPAIT